MPAKLLQNSLLVLAFACLVASGYWYFQRYGYFVPKPAKVIGSVQVAGAASYSGELTAPSSIALPNLGISLPVVITYMDGKRWPTTPSGVSYLANSALPGDMGNAVFYGHNWPSILGNLKNTKVGDQLTVQYQDGRSRSFTVDKVFVVGPNATEILAQSETPKITLYTCTGFLDMQRLVVTAI